MLLSCFGHFNLRKSGDRQAEQPLPFGTLVAVKRPGQMKSFGPFEPRGNLGRLILHEEGQIWKGFAAKHVLEVEDCYDDFVPEEYSSEGWTKVRLQNGRHAWLNTTDGLFRLTRPTLIDSEALERVIEDGRVEEDGVISDANSVACDLDNTVRLVPDASPVCELEMIVPDANGSCARDKTDSGSASNDSSNKHNDNNVSEDEEGYCCGCGMLVWQRCTHVIDYCPHYTCFDCRSSYSFDGARVWACRHHPELTRLGTELELCMPCGQNGGSRVSFAEPLVEQLVEFEVDSITLLTREHARKSRCKGKRVCTLEEKEK
eukprot:1734073-Amphidinium_carterae.2